MTDSTDPIYPDDTCDNSSAPHSGNTSDGFHTFDELYEHRMLLTAALFNDWARDYRRPKRGAVPPVVKSKKHSDGHDIWGGNWFIVVAQLPTGQISYHYEMKHWPLFYAVPAVQIAPHYDDHTPEDVVSRLTEFLTPPGLR